MAVTSQSEAQLKASPRHRVVVGISGASGAIYGVRLLQLLADRPDVESHLIVSRAGAMTINAETDLGVDGAKALADVVHAEGNVGATIASGSFRTAGMIVAPCSIKTLSAIANAYADNLIARAADVMLKERTPLVLMVRETPLHLGHIRLMAQATEAGAIVAPPVPAFYHRPTSIEDLVDHSLNRAIDQLGLGHSGTVEWPGLGRA